MAFVDQMDVEVGKVSLGFLENRPNFRIVRDNTFILSAAHD